MSSAEESQSGSDFEPDREQELESESSPDKHLNGTSRPNNPGTSKSADNGPPGPMSGNERAQLYTILRQLPMGFPRPDGQAPGPIPFPFPIPPALMAAANISDSNERLAAAHEAEAPPESVGARSPAVSTAPSSPNKPRPEPGTLEWARQRKDNHKEVERRRRGNINEGINELARIIPNGHGDKAKSAVLRRAVDYLHQLKESEQKTMERWTMEKLTHEQVVGEWAARYKECAEQLEVERERREELEVEVGRLKLLLGEKEEDELAEDEEQVLDHEEEEDHRSGSGDERPTKRMRVA
ncbi:basic helix-loop-helix protein [Serendipita sp. 405]|nr:basic helix-loop-helix protein [Serendipita sp. 405]